MRGGVHLVGGHFQKGRHLVDERTGTAGTGAVHPNLRSIGQKEDLGVLPAQLDDDVRPRRQLSRGHPGGEHLLDKGHPHALSHTHTGRAGDGQVGPAAGDVLLRHPAQQLLSFFQDMAEMTFVCTVNDVVRVIQHHAFNGGGAHVKSYLQSSFLLAGKRLPRQNRQQSKDTTLVGIILFSDKIRNRETNRKL